MPDMSGQKLASEKFSMKTLKNGSVDPQVKLDIIYYVVEWDPDVLS